MVMSFKEFTEEKIKLLNLPSFYGSTGPTKEEVERVEILEELLKNGVPPDGNLNKVIQEHIREYGEFKLV